MKPLSSITVMVLSCAAVAVTLGSSTASTTDSTLSSGLDGSGMVTATVDDLPMWRGVGVDAYAELGATVASRGDLTGDGLPDLVLGGMTGQLDGSPSMGTVMLFEGPLDATDEPLDEMLWTAVLRGPMASGTSVVCPVGDLDADGIGDLAVGMPQGGADAAGLAFVARGPLAGEVDLARDAQVYEGAGAGEGLGACAGPGDVDGDGVPDVVVAASDIRGGSGLGHVYLLRGPAEHSSLEEADQTLVGGEDAEHIGFNVAALGDLDGNGTDDYGVSNALGSTPTEDGVATYIVTDFASGTTHPRDAGVTVHYDLGGGIRSMLPSRVGDVDGDGYNDVALGVNRSAFSNRMVVLSGPFGAESSIDVSGSYDIMFEASDESPNPWLSFATFLGDWNDDGTGVLGLADAGFEPTWTGHTVDCSAGQTTCSYGAVFLVSEPIAAGTYDLATTADRVEGVLANGFMGGGSAGPAIQGGSDLSGDGIPDLAFSAWYADGVAAHTGAAYVLFGG